MISVNQAKKILNKGDRQYSDEQVKEIIMLLTKLGAIEYEIITKCS
jgi:Ca2+-binding EF-hand superfamily protein